MGLEAVCKGCLGKQSAEGIAQLETDFIRFRAPQFHFKVLLNKLTGIEAVGDCLKLKFEGQTATLHLGEAAATKWANKILNPPSRADKLGIRPDVIVFLDGDFEAAFRREVMGHLGSLAEAHLIFLAAADRPMLVKMPEIAAEMRATAALWIVYPKGQAAIRESDVIESGRSAGLKDVKVVRFSDSETALKFVIPGARR